MGRMSPHAPVSSASRRRLARWLVGSAIRDVERDLVLETLANTHGNRTVSARLLGVSVRTLRNKITEYSAEGVDVPRHKSRGLMLSTVTGPLYCTGVLERDELASARQRNQIVERSFPAPRGEFQQLAPSSSGSRNRFMVNSILADCRLRQLSTSVWYRSFGNRWKYSAASFLAAVRSLVNFSRMNGSLGIGL